MASSSITSWQIGGKVETVTDFIFLGSKITVNGVCSHEIKYACSLEGKLWQTHSFLPTKVHTVKDMVFPVVIYSFPGGSEDKVSACSEGDLGLIPGSGRSPGEGNGNPLQYSCLENPMDGGAWWAAVHRVAKSQTRLSDFTFFSFYMDIRVGP